MTDKKISELTSITGADVSDANDVLPIVDTSAATTKKITRAELFKSVSSVDINGGTIDGTVIGGSTPAAISGTTGQFGTSLNVDGTVTADGLTVDGNASLVSGGATRTLTLGPSGAGIEYNIDGTTTFQGRTDAYPVEFDTNSTRRMRLDSNGDISFYEDTGTTPKFFWDASAESLGIGTTSPSQALDVVGDIEVSGGIYLGGTTSANLLDDYEEGTWTPTDGSGAGLAISTSAASYTKIGNLCYIYAYITYPSTANSATQITGGLPFTAKSGATYAQLTIRSTSNTVSASNLTFQVTASGTSGVIYAGGAALVNAAISATGILISGCYEVA